MAGNGNGNGGKAPEGNGLSNRVAFLEKAYLEDRERWKQHHRQINAMLVMINRSTRNHEALVREVKRQNDEIKKQGEEIKRQGEEIKRQGERVERAMRMLYRRHEGL